jgi:DNA-binding response OmpR family regulator
LGPKHKAVTASPVPKALGRRHPLAHRRRVDPHQVAVGLPGRHLSVHFVQGRLQRRGDRVGIDTRLCVEQCRPTRAHPRAVQRDARTLSRHLRHSARPGQLLSKAQLEEKLHAFDFKVESNTIEVHVSRLRKKPGSAIIETERGMGYRLGRP